MSLADMPLWLIDRRSWSRDSKVSASDNASQQAKMHSSDNKIHHPMSKRVSKSHADRTKDCAQGRGKKWEPGNMLRFRTRPFLLSC